MDRIERFLRRQRDDDYVEHIDPEPHPEPEPEKVFDWDLEKRNGAVVEAQLQMNWTWFNRLVMNRKYKAFALMRFGTNPPIFYPCTFMLTQGKSPADRKLNLWGYSPIVDYDMRGLTADGTIAVGNRLYAIFKPMQGELTYETAEQKAVEEDKIPTEATGIMRYYRDRSSLDGIDEKSFELVKGLISRYILDLASGKYKGVLSNLDKSGNVNARILYWHYMRVEAIWFYGRGAAKFLDKMDMPDESDLYAGCSDETRVRAAGSSENYRDIRLKMDGIRSSDVRDPERSPKSETVDEILSFYEDFDGLELVPQEHMRKVREGVGEFLKKLEASGNEVTRGRYFGVFKALDGPGDELRDARLLYWYYMRVEVTWYFGDKVKKFLDGMGLRTEYELYQKAPLVTRVRAAGGPENYQKIASKISMSEGPGLKV